MIKIYDTNLVGKENVSAEFGIADYVDIQDTQAGPFGARRYVDGELHISNRKKPQGSINTLIPPLPGDLQERHRLSSGVADLERLVATLVNILGGSVVLTLDDIANSQKLTLSATVTDNRMFKIEVDQ